MKRYIAVDAGKFGTKIAEWDNEKKLVRKEQFRTKMGKGDMRDDALEKDTFLAKIGDVTYKLGNGARGNGAELETSKKTDIHRICTLAAIAKICSDNEADEISVAIGLPAKEWAEVSKREEYKAYILPEEEQKIAIKVSSEADPVVKTFTISQRFVFPESIGALFMDDSPAVTPTSYVGVLDIGNLNLNAAIWQGVELQQDETLTDELGGANLIHEVSQELSAKFTRCDEKLVASILKKVPSRRYLSPNNGDESIKEQSRVLIEELLKDYAERIKRCCDSKKWSLDYMELIAIGGTSLVIKDELKRAFGNITILNEPHYCNVLGYLRMMCAKESVLGIEIPLSATTSRTEKKEEKVA